MANEAFFKRKYFIDLNIEQIKRFKELYRNKTYVQYIRQILYVTFEKKFIVVRAVHTNSPSTTEYSFDALLSGIDDNYKRSREFRKQLKYILTGK